MDKEILCIAMELRTDGKCYPPIQRNRRMENAYV